MPTVAEAETSYLLDVFIQDLSVGGRQGYTGLLFDTAGLVLTYHRVNAAAVTTITKVTMTVGTFTSSGFKEIDSTNQPGMYQVGIPNAVFAVTFKGAVLFLKSTVNLNISMSPVRFELASSGGGGGGLTAAETRAALGMAAADLDDQLDALDANITSVSTNVDDWVALIYEESP